MARTPNKLVATLFAIWTVALFSHAPVVWLVGSDGIEKWSALLVSSQAILMLAILARAWGLGRAATTAVAVVAGGWAVEWIGGATGVPFGDYRYTERLQPQIAGAPLAVAVAWFTLLPPAWAVARVITGRWGGWRFVLNSAVALVAFDLFIDPQAVQWGWWVWESPGGYFGMPLTNYVGWFLVGAAMTAALRPRPFPIRLPLLVYATLWLTYTIGLSGLHGLHGPALCGFVYMGSVLALAGVKHLRRTNAISAHREHVYDTVVDLQPCGQPL